MEVGLELQVCTDLLVLPTLFNKILLCAMEWTK